MTVKLICDTWTNYYLLTYYKRLVFSEVISYIIDWIFLRLGVCCFEIEALHLGHQSEYRFRNYFLYRNIIKDNNRRSLRRSSKQRSTMQPFTTTPGFMLNSLREETKAVITFKCTCKIICRTTKLHTKYAEFLFWDKIQINQLLRFWYLSYSHIGGQRRLRQAGASFCCSHTWSMEVDEGPDQKSDI